MRIVNRENLRLNLILLTIIFLFGVVTYRLVHLQILNHEMWQALAQGQQTFFTSSQGERGEIFIRRKGDLIPAAVNEPAVFCFASPIKIKNKEKTAGVLSDILNLDQNKILKKVSNNKQFAALKHDLNPNQVNQLRELDLAGVYLEQEKLRAYPYQKLASHVIGFVGGNQNGQYGVEGFYNQALQGKPGFVKGERTLEGDLIFTEEKTTSQKGLDLVLTLDYNIQFFAERLLKQVHQELDARAGTIIVLKPDSGRVVALANFPNFDPNRYSEQQLELFKNDATQSLFEPGSVFKPVTMAAALDQDKITPETTYIDQGKVKIGGYTIYNYNQREWGRRTMTEVLEKSINTGAVFAERKLGHDLFLKYINKFGILEETGIDLEGELASKNKELRQGYEINFATASFGQGIEMTPIQLARAFSAIINGGKLVRPYVVDKFLRPVDGPRSSLIPPTHPRQLKILKARKTGQGVWKALPPSLKENHSSNPQQIISSETSSELTTMLISVVENGFGKRAQIPGYYVGGKTGTAQISWSALGKARRGYSNQTWQTFVGFVGVPPEFLILVKLDNPKTRTAEYSAIPVFHDLAKYIINYWEIPPDYEPQSP